MGANASEPENATKELDVSNASLNPDLEDLGIEWSEGTVGRLGEFDYASGSGWMYCLNNVFPNVGFADSYLTDGDVIRTQFTLALGSDIGGGQATGGGDNGKVRADKDDLTAAVASVNSAQNKAMLLANKEIKAAYDEANQVILDLPASQEKVDAACIILFMLSVLLALRKKRVYQLAWYKADGNTSTEGVYSALEPEDVVFAGRNGPEIYGKLCFILLQQSQCYRIPHLSLAISFFNRTIL